MTARGKKRGERGTRSVIHAGKTADCEEVLDCGSRPPPPSPPESNILGFTRKHVTFESRQLRGGPVPPSEMPQTCSQPQALVSLCTGFSG